MIVMIYIDFLFNIAQNKIIQFCRCMCVCVCVCKKILYI